MKIHVGQQEPQLVYAYAYQVARWVAVERAAAEIDRLTLIIESAVRGANDVEYEAIMTALKANSDALRAEDKKGNNNAD